MITLTSKPLLIAAAVAWSGIATAILSASHGPESVKAETSRFDDISAEPPLLKKADRLAQMTTSPTPVATEVVMVQPQQRIEKAEKPVKAKRERHKRVAGDICQRHHMHRVETHGGKSWRCKR